MEDTPMLLLAFKRRGCLAELVDAAKLVVSIRQTLQTWISGKKPIVRFSF